MNDMSGASSTTASGQTATNDPDGAHARRVRGAWPRLARATAVAAIAAAALGIAAGFVTFVNDIVAARAPAIATAEGIVVLTGGSARIDAALHLLAQGRAQRLLISGVNPAVGSRAIADTVDADLKSTITCCVDLGHEARDTIGNAAETRDWAEQHHYRSLIVVTSAYHMPRSLAELADAMPEVTLIPYPIANPELRLADWWNEPEAFALLVREYGKYLFAAVRLAVGAPIPAHTAATDHTATTGS
jgi:uncharacterized SAM-binding protein YcdF (DUF218 family)